MTRTSFRTALLTTTLYVSVASAAFAGNTANVTQVAVGTAVPTLSLTQENGTGQVANISQTGINTLTATQEGNGPVLNATQSNPTSGAANSITYTGVNNSTVNINQSASDASFTATGSAGNTANVFVIGSTAAGAAGDTVSIDQVGFNNSATVNSQASRVVAIDPKFYTGFNIVQHSDTAVAGNQFSAYDTGYAWLPMNVFQQGGNKANVFVAGGVQDINLSQVNTADNISQANVANLTFGGAETNINQTGTNNLINANLAGNTTNAGINISQNGNANTVNAVQVAAYQDGLTTTSKSDTISQTGNNNIANGQQNSTHNSRYDISQNGVSNNGTIIQSGSTNVAGLLQTGTNNLGMITQGGSANSVNVAQSVFNNVANVNQTGTAGTINITQVGTAAGASTAGINQHDGNGQTATITQGGVNILKADTSGDNAAFVANQINTGGGAINSIASTSGANSKVSINQSNTDGTSTLPGSYGNTATVQTVASASTAFGNAIGIDQLGYNNTVLAYQLTSDYNGPGQYDSQRLSAVQSYSGTGTGNVLQYYGNGGAVAFTSVQTGGNFATLTNTTGWDTISLNQNNTANDSKVGNFAQITMADADLQWTQTGTSNSLTANLNGGGGWNNGVAGSQTGVANTATIVQASAYVNDHSLIDTLNQTGNNNFATATQTNTIDSIYAINQTGNFNSATVTQTGLSNMATITQNASFNTATINQNGNSNVASIIQNTNGNTALISQTGNNMTLSIKQ